MKEAERTHLVLFVAGASPQSGRAIRTLASFVSGQAPGRYSWEIVDVHRDLNRARSAGVVAVPSLLMRTAAESRLFAGNIATRLRKQQ